MNKLVAGWEKRHLAPTCAGITLFAAFVLASCVGAVMFTPAELLDITLYALGIVDICECNPVHAKIWLSLRLPRLLLAMIVGGVLAASGTVMQSLFRNPLADPSLIGASSGAAVAAVAVIVLGLPVAYVVGISLLPIAAFCGSFLTLLVTYRLARRAGHADMHSLLLAGIAFNALATAMIGLLTLVSSQQALRSFTFWLLGGFGNVDWAQLTSASVFIIPSLVVFSSAVRVLDAMALGEREALWLGFSVERWKFLLLLVTALGIGASVAVAGIIGFCRSDRAAPVTSHHRSEPHLVATVFNSAGSVAGFARRSDIARGDTAIGVADWHPDFPARRSLVSVSSIETPFFERMSLQCKNVSYAIGEHALIKHFNFSLELGEILVIVGNNGAGKSTLLGLLAGCPMPDSGEVLLESRPLADWRLSDLAVRRAVLPQSPSIAFNFKVSEVVRLGALPHPVQDQKLGERLLEAMQWVDISHLQNRGYFSLSGGERQRVHLARVLLQLGLNPTVPRYLLLDEPLAMLDLMHQYMFMELLRTLVSSDSESGIGIALVTHDLNIAMRYADRVCFVKAGRCYVTETTAKAMTPGNLQAVFDVNAKIVQQTVITWPLKK